MCLLTANLIRCETNEPSKERYPNIHYLTGHKSFTNSNHTTEPDVFSNLTNNSTKVTFLQNGLTKVVTHKRDELNPETENKRDQLFKRRRNKPRRKRKGNRKKMHGVSEDGRFVNINKKKGKRKSLEKRFRKKRKNKKQKEPEKESSILEITTAKTRNQIVLDVNNSSLGILIEKLNQNPEMNYNHLISSFRVGEAAKPRPQIESQAYKNKTHLQTLMQNNKVQIFSDDSSTSRTFVISDIEKHITNANRNVLQTTQTTPTTLAVTGAPLETSVNDLNELQILFLRKNRINYKNQNNKCKLQRSGCAHICDETDPNKCACLEGYYLAADGRDCLGKLSEWRYR